MRKALVISKFSKDAHLCCDQDHYSLSLGLSQPVNYSTVLWIVSKLKNIKAYIYALSHL